MSLDTIIILIFVAIVVLIFLKRRRPGGYFAPAFEKRPIMNRPEQFIFDLLRREFPSHWHVMTQVSYGSFLKCQSDKKFRSINSKRADFVVLYPKSLDVAAIFEYHGSGHYGSTDHARRRAEISDKIKYDACVEADIHYVELPAYVDKNELSDLIRDIVRPPMTQSTADVGSI